MSLEDPKIKPPIMLPDDGPPYHEENASAALLKSTYRPFDDWNGLRCPVDGCRQQFLTDEAISRHVDEQHDRGRWLARGIGALGALDVIGRLWVATNSNSSPSAAHLTQHCIGLTQTDAFRTVDNPAQMPLGVDHVCWRCLDQPEEHDVN
jgi:hypothetical protein